MPWVNLDDQMPEHPKNWALSDAAFRLHTAGICYCNRHLTDGFIAADKVPTLVPRYKRGTLTELIERTLWMPAADGQTYEIRDYLQWNKSREVILAEVERQRKQRSAAGKKGAEKRWRG